MPWGNKRTSSTAWRTLRLQILRRDRGVCYKCGLQGANEVDHIKPHHLGGTDHPSNLAAICHHCHTRKSSAEGNAKRWSIKEQREPERHPGLIDG